jgi:D-alanyl-D-alanine carboxypeptidase
LSITSAFRTAERQRQLFSRNGYRDGAIARPYHSEHQTGRALDLWGPGGLLDARGPSPTGLWVADNAHYYGFIIRYRAETTHITGYIHEPWHITYVGTAISMYMFENNILSLEEFVGRNPGAGLI